MVDFNDELQRALAELREPEDGPSPDAIPDDVHERAVEILSRRLVRDGRALGQHTPANTKTLSPRLSRRTGRPEVCRARPRSPPVVTGTQHGAHAVCRRRRVDRPVKLSPAQPDGGLERGQGPLDLRQLVYDADEHDLVRSRTTICSLMLASYNHREKRGRKG
jgi:hypothetical protein